MAYYPDEIIETINQSADIVELISNYVTLKRAGNSYKGLCPFHNEKTPSFIVTPHKHMFHCFGCGAGGGAIRFLMMIAGHSFPEAVEELARRYGVELPQQEGRPSSSMPRESKSALYEVLKHAQLWFENNLWAETGTIARHYLKQRGISVNAAKDFGLGYAPESWDGLLKHLSGKGFGQLAMSKAGLIKTGREPGSFYDAFRNRLMVPIIDAENRVAAFGGRLMADNDKQPKYLNSPETPVYSKGRLLYGFNKARPFLRAAGMVFLVEGYFDLISMVTGGINEVTATLGTALTSSHLNLLKGHVRDVFLLFDSDEAGQRAAARALPLLLNAELDGRVLLLPQGHDPDSFMREFGAEALYESASQALDIVDFYVSRQKSAHPDTLAGQARMAREAKELLAQVPDNAKSRLLMRKLARMMDLDESLLGNFATSPKPLRHTAKNTEKKPQYDQIAGTLLKFIVVHPESAALVFDQMAAYWPDDISKVLFERLRADYLASATMRPELITCDESEDLSALMSEAVLSERWCRADESSGIAEAYMKRLKEKWRKKRNIELSLAIKKAQAQNDELELLRLLKEKKDLLS